MNQREDLGVSPAGRGSARLAELPVTVWPTAQRSAASQRVQRYVPESTRHPAKMLPAIARHAVEVFTEPGDLVLDPLAGIGTSLVEAVHAGRTGVGVEYEARWVEVARANLALAAQLGAPGEGRVLQGDARHVLPALAAEQPGTVRLLLTSPPYGASTHGLVSTTKHSRLPGVRKTAFRYGRDRANLAHRSLPTLLRGFTEILREALPVLAPGGIVAITTRPFRSAGELVDFPSFTLDAAVNAGLEPVQRCVALLAGLRNGRLVPRSSFFQLDYVRKLRSHGVPAWVIAHEDVLILRRLAVSPSGAQAAAAPTGPQRLRCAA